jgi:cardiolipin synthase
MHDVTKIPAFDAIDAHVDGHHLRVALTGADRYSMLMSVIAEATESLRLFFYIFADDSHGRAVVEALEAAALRGVRVWLIVDGFGSKDTPDSFFAALVKAGGGFDRFNARFGWRYLLRNHQKMVIADKKVAIVGGANVQSAYFVDRPGHGGWHDLFLRVEGPAASRLAHYFDTLRRWLASDAPTIRGILHILSRRSDKKGPLRWLFNGPFRRMGPLTQSIKHDIERAKSIRMVEAYFSPNWGMLRRLARVVKRGGSVSVLTPSLSDNDITVAAARYCYGRLLKGDVAVYEFQPQMLHMKLIIVDDCVYVGSANFDMRSLFINGEVMLRIDDAAFAARMRAMYDEHLTYARPVTNDLYAAARTWFARAYWMLSYFFITTADFTVTRRFNVVPRRIAPKRSPTRIKP